MMVIDTFVQIRYTDEFYQLDFDERFFSLADKKNEQTIKNIMKNNDVYNGFIKITDGNITILNQDHIDRLDNQWLFLTDSVHQYIKEKHVADTFPGEPTEFSLSSHKDQYVTFQLGENTYDLPEKEFLIKTLMAGKIFFKTHMEATNTDYYQPTLKQIEEHLMNIQKQQ
jgi:hypothetical protein